jgi:hypothetical protein
VLSKGQPTRNSGSARTSFLTFVIRVSELYTYPDTLPTILVPEGRSWKNWLGLHQTCRSIYSDSVTICSTTWSAPRYPVLRVLTVLILYGHVSGCYVGVITITPASARRTSGRGALEMSI